MSESVTARMRRQTRRTVNGSSTSAIGAMNPFSNTFVLAGDDHNPLWYAEDVRYPPEVEADGAVDIAIDMVNEQTVISPFNDNVCRDGLYSGLESEITIDPEWDTAQSVTDCLEVGGFSPSRRTHQFDFPAPSSPGTYEFTVEVRATGTGAGGVETFQVVIPDESDDDDGAGSRPGPGPGDGDDSSGGGGVDIPGVPDIPGLTDGGTVTLFGLLVLFLAVGVAS